MEIFGVSMLEQSIIVPEIQRIINARRQYLEEETHPHYLDGLVPIQRIILWILFQEHSEISQSEIVYQVDRFFKSATQSNTLRVLENLHNTHLYRYPFVVFHLNSKGICFYSIDPRIRELLLFDKDDPIRNPIKSFVPLLLLRGVYSEVVMIPSYNLLELMDWITKGTKLRGPDLATGGYLLEKNFEELGVGEMVVRGRYKIENNQLIVLELPFLVSPRKFLDQIQNSIRIGELDCFAEVWQSQDNRICCLFRDEVDIPKIQKKFQKLYLEHRIRLNFKVFDGESIRETNLLDCLMVWKTKMEAMLFQFDWEKFQSTIRNTYKETRRTTILI